MKPSTLWVLAAITGLALLAGLSWLPIPAHSDSMPTKSSPRPPVAKPKPVATKAKPRRTAKSTSTTRVKNLPPGAIKLSAWEIDLMHRSEADFGPMDI